MTQQVVAFGGPCHGQTFEYAMTVQTMSGTYLIRRFGARDRSSGNILLDEIAFVWQPTIDQTCDEVVACLDLISDLVKTFCSKVKGRRTVADKWEVELVALEDGRPLGFNDFAMTGPIPYANFTIKLNGTPVLELQRVQTMTIHPFVLKNFEITLNRVGEADELLEEAQRELEHVSDTYPFWKRADNIARKIREYLPEGEG